MSTTFSPMTKKAVNLLRGAILSAALGLAFSATPASAQVSVTILPNPTGAGTASIIQTPPYTNGQPVDIYAFPTDNPSTSDPEYIFEGWTVYNGGPLALHRTNAFNSVVVSNNTLIIANFVSGLPKYNLTMVAGVGGTTSPTGTVTVLNGAGARVAEDTFSTDEAHETRCGLQGQPGEQFKVIVNDDQRGVFTLQGGDLKIVMQTGPEFHIGGVGKGRYWFFVPEGTTEFRIRLLGVHTGGYGAVVLTPSRQIAGQHQDANPGSALIPGAPQTTPQPPTHPERGEIVIKPAAGDTGKLWSVVLWAAGDLGVELVGVPPYLSLTEDGWFRLKEPEG